MTREYGAGFAAATDSVEWIFGGFGSSKRVAAKRQQLTTRLGRNILFKPRLSHSDLGTGHARPDGQLPRLGAAPLVVTH